MSQSMEDTLSGIRRFEPVPWNLIPDLGLYMDQVITFVTRMYAPVYGDSASYLSPAMINNYVKGKLIPRPTGKKYSREQIALVTMIVALKHVCTIDDIRRMLTLKEGETVEALYTSFCQRMSHVFQTMRCGEATPFGQLSSALDFAILSSGFSAGCAALLQGDAESEGNPKSGE